MYSYVVVGNAQEPVLCVGTAWGFPHFERITFKKEHPRSMPSMKSSTLQAVALSVTPLNSARFSHDMVNVPASVPGTFAAR